MKIWLDDLREAPEGYILCHSVNEARQLIEENEKQTFIEVIDCDHDLGDYYPDGGDGIKLIDWLAERGTYYPVRLHTMNPVGRENMQRIISPLFQKGEMMFYYIADTHFGHENIIRMCGRPFGSIDAMNEGMIAAWNERVSGNDTVFILGDLFFRCADPEAILCRLKGRKRLIVGNHDTSWMSRVDLQRYFVSVDNLLEITDGVRAITLCHYPLLTWKHKLRTYMIHGHIHNDTSSDYFPLIASRERVLNAGVDINGFRPVTFDELLANNAAFKNEWRNSGTPMEDEAT